MAKIALLLGLLLLLVASSPVFAAEQNVVTPTILVRSRDLWRQQGDPKHLEFLIDAFNKTDIPSTWLLQYEAMLDPQITVRLAEIKSRVEFGVFLEVSHTMASDSLVAYNWYQGHWSAADKLFTSGYSLDQRERLVSTAMEKFREKFGSYPSAVGAWHIDGWTLKHLKDKYGVQVILGLADQYSTDGYQVWGQYVNQPYYISSLDPLEPSAFGQPSGLVKVLWAPRKQVLAFSRQAQASNYSVQANDYYRAMKLPSAFFDSLVDELTINVDAPLAQAVVGIEVAEIEEEYWPELKRQFEQLRDKPELKLLTMTEFATAYHQSYPESSPALLYESSSDSLQSWWFMSPGYRLGVRLKDNQVELIDLRIFQSLPVADNDQRWPDHNSNLHRVVPALIDEVGMGNTQTLGTGPVSVLKEEGVWKLKFEDKELVLSPSRPSFRGINPAKLTQIPTEYLEWNGPDLKVILPKSTPPSTRCFEETGSYSPPFPCLKKWVSDVLNLLPDLRYSKIDGQFYFGLRTGPEEFVGLTLPKISIGKMTIPFSSLEYFLSLRNLIPQFSWQGRQELQAKLYKMTPLVQKAGQYGQNEVLKSLPNEKRFENGYYFVPR